MKSTNEISEIVTNDGQEYTDTMTVAPKKQPFARKIEHAKAMFEKYGMPDFETLIAEKNAKPKRKTRRRKKLSKMVNTLSIN
jgi:hypothetical protein